MTSRNSTTNAKCLPIVRCALALAVGLVSVSIHAQSTTVSIGKKAIVIPGLSTLVSMKDDQRIMNWAAAVVERDERLLSVSLEKDDPGIQDLSIARYIIVQTPRNLEQAGLNEADFKDLKIVLRKSTTNLATLSDNVNLRADEVAAGLSKATESQFEQLQVGVPALLKVQRDEDRGFGYTYIAKFQAEIDGKQTSWRTVSCNNTLLLKGKLLIINTFSVYRDASDLKWLSTTCRQFADGVIAANNGEKGGVNGTR